MKRNFGVAAQDSHIPSLGREESSTTGSWRPFCSCGWSGIAIFELFDANALNSVFKNFSDEHGLSSILPADAIFGNENDALVQVLNHLDYNPRDDEKYATEAFDSEVESVKNFSEDLRSSQDRYEVTFFLTQLAEDLIDQKHRAAVWESTPIPELRSDGKEMELRLRKTLIESWEHKESRTTK